MTYKNIRLADSVRFYFSFWSLEFFRKIFPSLFQPFTAFRWRVNRDLSVVLLGLSSFSNGPWDCCPIRNNFIFILSRRLAACPVQSFSVIFQEPVERRFGVFIDGADGGHQTGVQEGFHSFAKLFRLSFSGTRHLGR